MPQSGIQRRQKGLRHPKPGGNDSQHTPPEALRPHRRDEDEQFGSQTVSNLRVVRFGISQHTVPALMQLSPATRKDTLTGDNNPRNLGQQCDAELPSVPPQIQMETRDSNAVGHEQPSYPTAVSYVQGQPQDAVNAHYVHAPQHITAPPGHHAYAWHQAQLQQYPNPAIHHHGHHQLAHRAYVYPVHHSVMQSMSHVPHTQLGHIPHTIWNPMHPPHVHGPHPHSTHAAYASPIPLPAQDVPQAPYPHYFQQQVPLVQQTHVGAPPSNPSGNPLVSSDNFAHSGPSRASEPRSNDAQPVQTTKANVKKASELNPLKRKPPDTGSKNFENPSSKHATAPPDEKKTRMTKIRSTAEQGTTSGSVTPSGSSPKTDPKRPPVPPSAKDQVKKPDGTVSTASNKPAVNRHHAGSSTKPREKQLTPPIRKSRKPYTITKNRESWSEKEHLRFLEALQLYNRDWKRIEAHIGTKTVLQIRSHAQKHFCKVAKYKTGEYIPPARPKRRASQPYPRSRGTSNGKSSSNGDMTSGRSQDRAIMTTGSEMASDSGAGSSDNGNVSGTGHAKGGSGRNSDGSGNGMPHRRPVDQRRSVDRCSDSLPSYKKNSEGQSTAEETLDSNANQRLNKTNTSLPIPVACLNMAVRPPALPGSYEHYYFNVVRPNGLPYGTGFYQGSHYPAQHPQYAWHDSACGQHNYHNQGIGYSGIPPGVHHSSSHGIDPQVTQVRNQACPSNRPVEQWRKVPDEKDGMTSNGHMDTDTPLAVLSNCIDMVTRQNADKPARGWASAAAARRAHRVRVIRERKMMTVRNGKRGDDMGDGKSKADGNIGSTKRMRRASRDESDQKTEGTEKATENRPVQAETPRNNDVLICPGQGAHNAGVMDVGSDEAVAGFSGSDRQESGSDGAAGGSTGRSRTPDNIEEDPNSSNDGSGDDGRRNSRSSSPADPNSSGSREESPSGPETVGSHNGSSGNDTPAASREATPTDSGNASAGDGGSSKTETAKGAPIAGANLAGCPKRNGKNPVNNTLMVAAERLSSLSGSQTANNASSGSKNKNPKTQIGSLLNSEPCNTFESLSEPHEDQKRK